MAEFKLEPKFEPLPVIWQFLRRLFQKLIEGVEGKINGQALGAALLSCLCWSDGEHKHMAFLSWQQSLLAATGSLEDNMLTLLLH